MRKALFALIILLVAVSIAGLVVFATESSGEGRGHGAQMDMTSSADLRTVGLVIFVVPLALAVAVAVYMVAFPEIKKTQLQTATLTDQSSAPPVEQQRQALDAVLRVLNEDERKVVQAVADSEKGSMLQKEIRWKTNLSRVKVHRVVSRLSERGIVKVEKQVNTNKVTLAEWISKNGQSKPAAK